MENRSETETVKEVKELEIESALRALRALRAKRDSFLSTRRKQGEGGSSFEEIPLILAHAVMLMLLFGHLLLAGSMLFPLPGLDEFVGGWNRSDAGIQIMLISMLLLVLHSEFTSPNASAYPYVEPRPMKPRTPRLILDDPRLTWKR